LQKELDEDKNHSRNTTTKASKKHIKTVYRKFIYYLFTIVISFYYNLTIKSLYTSHYKHRQIIYRDTPGTTDRSKIN